MTAPDQRPPAAFALRAKLSLAAPALRTTTAELWRRQGLGSRYARYLRTMHAVVRASVPLMEQAAAKCRQLGAGDPVADRLARYLDEHAVEERGHDDWLLADLAAVGEDPAAALAEPPPPAVASLVGAQYYWIEHHHPVALLGYIAVLEGNAPAPWLADRLAALTGLPEAAFRTVRDHAELDTGHVRALDELLDTLPLTPAQERTVAVSALHTADALTSLFARLSRPPLTAAPDHHGTPMTEEPT
ncbi:iron-containing redox enzyme family protein [Wenjunlia tyrosinilytica]|uniref:Iron-containing redox enzyme family protein n=1 Tax=Wenjunlia tyrosinilytica TaxID=1544741 RepID=A0A917ZX47_9ACTN|nr:iron-containing redox enzyme family protein [Wenjunlia tyrosinilytica]GGP00002.1 hypothetical protein GCM10012280_67730 [Wenjunlia tyrosinilytica]